MGGLKSIFGNWNYNSTSDTRLQPDATKDNQIFLPDTTNMTTVTCNKRIKERDLGTFNIRHKKINKIFVQIKRNWQNTGNPPQFKQLQQFI